MLSRINTSIKYNDEASKRLLIQTVKDNPNNPTKQLIRCGKVRSSLNKIMLITEDTHAKTELEY